MSIINNLTLCRTTLITRKKYSAKCIVQSDILPNGIISSDIRMSAILLIAGCRGAIYDMV
jgi:hypothetical protein